MLCEVDHLDTAHPSARTHLRCESCFESIPRQDDDQRFVGRWLAHARQKAQGCNGNRRSVLYIESVLSKVPARRLGFIVCYCQNSAAAVSNRSQDLLTPGRLADGDAIRDRWRWIDGVHSLPASGKCLVEGGTGDGLNREQSGHAANQACL